MNEPDQRAAALLGQDLDGAYRLTRVIAEGGMGTVYEALQLRLNRRVAVKVMVPELAANAEALARFRREVAVTSQLAHPHVIHLVDFGTAPSGQPYLVMEYLEGEDLSQRLARVKTLPPTATANIVIQAALALTATHAKGIVHRDLKPANLFLLRTDGVVDFVKLVDFGISKVRTSDAKLTRASVMMGTPHYMSPEQALGRVDDVDHRSDQWALACIAWEMLCGSFPFDGADINAVLQNVAYHEPPRLDTLVPGLPRELEPTLRRALSKKQADRFPTIAAFSRTFEAAAGGVARGASEARPDPAPPRSGRGATLALVAAIAIALASSGAFIYSSSYRPEWARWIPTAEKAHAPAARKRPAPTRTK